MEINTSYEISEKESVEICKSHIEYDIFANKKWVSVESLHKYLDGYFLKNNVAVTELIRHIKNDTNNGRYNESK